MDGIFTTLSNVPRMVKDLFTGDISLSNIPTIDRSIVDPNIRLGSLYDARTDTIIDYGKIQIKSLTKNVHKKSICRMIKGNDFQREDFLRILDIDDDIRLSVALKLIPRRGILSIIDYSLPINQFTRLIYYFHQSGNESFVENLSENSQFFDQFIPDGFSTHIITKIKYGIGLAMILQIKPVEHSLLITIDDILTRLCSQLDNHLDHCYLSREQEENLLTNINSTKIYSNIDDHLSDWKNIYDICQYVQRIKRNTPSHQPLNFKMHSISSLYPSFECVENSFHSINLTHLHEIERYLFSLFGQLVHEDLFPFLEDHLPEQFDHAKTMFTNVNNDYLIEMKLFRNTVIAIRSGHISSDELIHLFEQRSMKEKFDDCKFHFDQLIVKKDLIIYLQQERIDYLNVQTMNINEENFQDKLSQHDRNICVFCSNDYLRNSDHEQWDKCFAKFLKERKQNDQLDHFIYADFTYSSFDLKRLNIFKWPRHSHQEQMRTKLTIPLSQSSRMNILLFGESGVGKSTFINAFTNYLQFNQIEQARLGEVQVIIPVSFLMTINDQFDEKQIRFGQQNSNENHNEIGQSVTQQCQSYQFRDRNNIELNLIDTPGFGDTRGDEQDQRNLHQIFSFIEKLDHLNALCILLRPNIKQFSPSFRSSLRAILHYFGNDFYRNNLFFCFTNSQSTFFTIGDTAPLLNQFLRIETDQSIDLRKENTFCFDSESFRYLIASQQSIQFDEQFIDQFKQSWQRSVKESHRLIDQIGSRDKQFSINHQWISREEIKRQLKSLLRPLLKSIRNLLQRSIAIPSSMLVCDRTSNDMQIMIDHSDLDVMIKSSAIFDSLFNYNEDRPFLLGINRMIDEEKELSQVLQKRKQQYDQEFNGINPMDEYEHLKSIYSRIESLKIYEQLHLMKDKHQKDQ